VGPVSGERKRMIPTLRSLVLAGVVSYATVLCLTIMSVTGPHQTIPYAPITQNKVVLGMTQKHVYWHSILPQFGMICGFKGQALFIRSLFLKLPGTH